MPAASSSSANTHLSLADVSTLELGQHLVAEKEEHSHSSRVGDHHQPTSAHISNPGVRPHQSGMTGPSPGADVDPEQSWAVVAQHAIMPDLVHFVHVCICMWPAYIPVRMRAHMSAYVCMFLPSCSCLGAWVPGCLPKYLPAWVHACMPTRLPACLLLPQWRTRKTSGVVAAPISISCHFGPLALETFFF